MKHLLIAFALAFSFPLTLSSQNSTISKSSQKDLVGFWLGKITQKEGGYRSEYTFQVNLRIEGDKLVGTARVLVDDIFATMNISGQLRSGILFHFQEGEIIESRQHEGMEWCIKKGQLLVKTKHKKMLLEGFWQGVSGSLGDCVPGEIFLEKVATRA